MNARQFDIRVCRLCGISKLLTDFYRSKNCISGGGIDSKCKTCSKQISARNQRSDKHRARRAAWAKDKWLNCAENRKRRLESSRRFFSRPEVKAAQVLKKKARIEADRDAYLLKRRERYSRRKPHEVLHARIASRLHSLLKGKKNASSFQILGYSKAELMAHLERQFLPGMCWENIGRWHIDHVVPLSSFNISAADDPSLRVAWGLPNLRPLWAADNLRKHAKRLFLL